MVILLNILRGFNRHVRVNNTQFFSFFEDSCASVSRSRILAHLPPSNVIRSMTLFHQITDPLLHHPPLPAPFILAVLCKASGEHTLSRSVRSAKTWDCTASVTFQRCDAEWAPVASDNCMHSCGCTKFQSGLLTSTIPCQVQKKICMH